MTCHYLPFVFTLITKCFYDSKPKQIPTLKTIERHFLEKKGLLILALVLKSLNPIKKIAKIAKTAGIHAETRNYCFEFVIIFKQTLF
jgi:hypothetical protein